MTVLLDRNLTGTVELADRDTLVGLVMPWNVDAEVFDELPDGTTDHYLEAFDRGAFDGQARSGNRGTLAKIELVESHTGGLGKVGYALELEDREDGQYGAFRVLPRHRDDIAQMVDDGIDGLSVRFIPKHGGTRLSRIVNGVERRLRTAAHIVHVAVVPEPAYAPSRVLAIRDVGPVDARELAAAAARDREALEIAAHLETVAGRWDHLVRSRD